MGLQNRNSSTKYLRLKDGKFYIGKELEGPYDQLEGQITNMYYKNEEYEGVPQRKLILVITDAEDTYQLGLNVDTSNYSSLISFLKEADLNQPLTLHPKMDVVQKDGKETKRYAVLVSQNDKYSKSYLTKEVSEKIGLPQWDIVTVGKKKVTDKSAYLEFLEEFVTTNYINKLSKQVVTEVKKPNLVEVDDELEDGETSKGLPWD